MSTYTITATITVDTDDGVGAAVVAARGLLPVGMRVTGGAVITGRLETVAHTDGRVRSITSLTGGASTTIVSDHRKVTS